MICIYEANTKSWTGNGLCILQPSSCTVKEIAGGDFGLTQVCPVGRQHDHLGWDGDEAGYSAELAVPVIDYVFALSG